MAIKSITGCVKVGDQFMRIQQVRAENKVFRFVGERAPKKGEWFLSGAKPALYEATTDMDTVYLTFRVVEMDTKELREYIECLNVQKELEKRLKSVNKRALKLREKIN